MLLHALTWRALSLLPVLLIAGVAAQTVGFDPILTPTDNESIPIGTTFAITWDPNRQYQGGVIISLAGGSKPTEAELLGEIICA
jgi:hypothetical protein